MGSLQRNPIRRNFKPYAPPTVAEPGPRPARPARPAPPPVSLPEPGPELQPLKPAPHAFAVVLVIDGTGYAASLLPREPGDLALRVWSLVRLGAADAEPYQVAELPANEGRWSCTCGDFVFRHEGNGSACKHCRAIQHGVDHGLLAPLPLVLATDPDAAWDQRIDPSEGWTVRDPEHFDGTADGDPYDVTPMARKAAASA
jgi:hypothetical protein